MHLAGFYKYKSGRVAKTGGRVFVVNNFDKALFYYTNYLIIVWFPVLDIEAFPFFIAGLTVYCTE
jgi:hypothetical protein